LREQSWGDALDALDKEAASAEGTGKSGLTWLASRIALERAGDRERGVAALKRVLELDPKHPQAFFRLRANLQESQRWDELKAVLLRRVAHESDATHKARLHRELAHLERDALSDLAASAQQFAQALTFLPDHRETLRELSDVLLQGERYKEAL